MKKLFSIFALLAIMNVAFAIISVSANASKSVLKPGESGVVTLTISNVDASDSINGMSVTVYGTPEFTYKSSISVGDMSPGTSTSVSFPVTASGDAASGIYIFDIKVQGFVETASGNNLNYKSASVPIYVLSKPLLLIKDYRSDFSENEIFNFTIRNEGGIAENARLMVLSPFAISGSNEVFLGSIENEKEVSLALDVSGVNEGQNTLSISFVYEDELGNEVNDTKNVSITVKKERADISFSQLSEISARKDNNARFMVVNGDKAVKDVRLKFQDQNIIVKNGDEIEIGDLGSSEQKELAFTMHPLISPGTSNVNATLTYVEDGKVKSKSISVALTVTSDSDVQVFIEAKPLPLTSGTEHTISITVANTWDYQIESTSVKIEGAFYELISVQNEQYIGLLGKDDFSSVQFKVKIDDGASRESNLTIRIRYKDSFGNFVERTKNVPLAIAEKKIEQNYALPVAAGAAAIVAAWFFFFRRKK